MKDISSSVRRDPTGQLQINFKAKPEKRTRHEFIELLFKKMAEGYIRQINKSTKELEVLEIGDAKAKLVVINKQAEEKINMI